VTSPAAARRRYRAWSRYIDRTSRTSLHHHRYPWGLSTTITPGYFAPRRIMTHRDRQWYTTRAAIKELDTWPPSTY
jgi:hypothetical protein